MHSRYPPEHLQALRDRIRLSDLIGRTVVLKREGREHVGLCPFHQEKTPSFSVNDSKGIWRCFGCHKGGDCIDFTRLAFRMSFKEAVEALTSQHGLNSASPVIDPATARRAEDRRRREEDRARHYLDAARRIWADAIPAENSPVERYLRSRSITDPIPASIRYHPELVYRLDQKTRIILPGMVAQVCNCAGEMIGLHRTFIKRDGLGKADVPKVKLMLGDARGGAVFLGSITGRAIDPEIINVTEGIETGFSLQHMNGTPTFAALSTGGMIALELPELPVARRVTIGADNDQNGAGVEAAIKAATRWRDEGRQVRIITPRGVKDWNDLLRAPRPQSPTPIPAS